MATAEMHASVAAEVPRRRSRMRLHRRARERAQWLDASASNLERVNARVRKVVDEFLDLSSASEEGVRRPTSETDLREARPVCEVEVTQV
ncbi:MAG: hypothetical protein JST00_07385 [Deltaproteobacteria bacterium]|nr:hypothetical protein [Deltaproteobacteria bacterium]